MKNKEAREYFIKWHLKHGSATNKEAETLADDCKSIIDIMQGYAKWMQDKLSGKEERKCKCKVPYIYFNQEKQKEFCNKCGNKSPIQDLDKKECWACFEKLPKGHKSGLCSDCQMRG